MQCFLSARAGLRARAWRPPAALAFTLALPLLAQAQPASDARALERVVVTGARSEQVLDEALAPLTLITRADLDRLQATDLVELIGRQAGIQFVRSGGPGGQTSVFARGAGSSQLLVLVDGVRLNAVTGGFAVLGGIHLDTIERIEIVRGNLSSLYGSEAIGGVIQIFTRGGAADEVVARVEAGSGSTRAGSLSAARGFGPLRASATAAARRSAPFSAIDPAAAAVNPDVDGNRHRSGSLRLAGGLGEATQFALSAWTQRNRTDFDATFENDPAATTHLEDARSESWQARATQRIGESFKLNALVGEATDESENRVSDPASFNGGRFESRNRQAQLQLLAPLAEQLEAQLGAEYLDQRGAANAYDPAFSNRLTRFGRHVSSGWLGVTGRTPGAGRHQLQLNARSDDYSDVGRKATWLAAYGHALTPSLRATLQASTAFRAPSFNDLYFPGFGNTALRPERARSEEAGLRWHGGHARAALALFRTRTRDLVQFDPASARAENVARAKAQGVELAAGALRGTALGVVQLDANATWLRTEDEASGQRLVRRAPRQFNLALFLDEGRWRVGGEASYVAARDDFDINLFSRKALPAYTLLRAVAEWRVSRQLTMKLRAENLTDEKYTLVDGYNSWGRSLFGGVELRL